jgi:quinoprotein glucose dehydrogenase
LRSLNLPPLGIPGRAAVVVTKHLIFVGESSDAVFLGAVTHGFGDKFRAYGKVDEKVRAEVTLPVGTTGAPITYVVNGKQYVVVAVGGTGHGSEWVALGL